MPPKPSISAPMTKRVPKNPKYEHLKSTLDTGASMSRYLARLDDLRTNYKYKPNEAFRRIRASTLVQLILETAIVRNREFAACNVAAPPAYDDSPPRRPHDHLGDGSARDEDGDTLAPMPDLNNLRGFRARDAPTNNDDNRSMRSTFSTLHDVITGVGELDMSGRPSSPGAALIDMDGFEEEDGPVLLLDVREKDEFDLCHAIGARCHPATMLSRTMNPFSADALRYKNKAGRLIVIYDETESIAPRVATIFVERGFENVFMLSGGLKVLAQKFPYGLIAGPLPVSCIAPASAGKSSGGTTARTTTSMSTRGASTSATRGPTGAPKAAAVPELPIERGNRLDPNNIHATLMYAQKLEVLFVCNALFLIQRLGMSLGFGLLVFFSP
eukprot:Opistho-2@13060